LIETENKFVFSIREFFNLWIKYFFFFYLTFFCI
jgi:hypothetical protein